MPKTAPTITPASAPVERRLCSSSIGSSPPRETPLCVGVEVGLVAADVGAEDVDVAILAVDMKSFFETLSGVLEFRHASSMVSYTTLRSPREDLPKQIAVFVTKPPPSRHRQAFVTETVPDSHFDVSAAAYIHPWALFG